ncbi:MAG: sigma-54 dependent transcriptional regulator [Syntrophales bacterium]|nr:sigma-54 dependent transcriptional regulator [Syntrophales bacterium]
MRGHILIVDDDREMRDFLEILLEKEGYKVKTAERADKALRYLSQDEFDLIITDLKMPKIDGLDFLRRVREINEKVRVILVTAFASAETAYEAMKEGAFDYVEKHFEVDSFLDIVERALKQKKEKKEGDGAFTPGQVVKFGQMLTRNKEMIRIFNMIKKIADTTANVLILGESGTGKELVARAIHEHSSRKSRPFVAINCGGIPENLLESELFGHVKGSFTGAYTDKIGLMELASGGTVFLDEISELTPALQVKLLRVVEEKSFRRVGGGENIHVNIRIISATNRNLQERVKAGKFREDLYYRLNVIPIELPPLRHRKEDIPILVEHFIEKYARAFSKEIRNISSYALELLSQYSFPGNIRELEHIIERSVALETSNIILPDNLIFDLTKSEDALSKLDEIGDEGINLNEVLTKIEKSLIEKALKKVNGSRTKAAELLHITVDSLKYRMEKLNIT